MDKSKYHKSGEPEISQDSKPEKEKGKKPPPKKTIGAVLRDEREKKRLSYAQVSEIIRLRPSILEALENESWSDLPSPALARGFICSYGRTLGLEEKKLTALYRKSDPIKVSAPRPLAEPAKNKKIFLVILVLILPALMSFYYLWKGYTPQETVVVVPKRISPEKSITKNTGETPNIPKNHRKALSNEQNQIEPDTVITHGPDLIKQTDFLVEEEKEPVSDNGSTTAIESAVPELTLKANIREKTWVKIIVDDNEPEEFMFNPGRHYEWKAKKGFELMIGNAGGIDLEFNGEAVAKPSTPGRVVRLTLPKNYERTGSQ